MVTILDLILYSFDDTAHRRLKELGHLRSSQLQLPKPNIARLVGISCSSKLDVLRLFITAESDLCGLVEASDDVIQVFDEV